MTGSPAPPERRRLDLGARGILEFGAALGWLVFNVLRIRRAHVEASLARAQLDAAIARDVYRDLGLGLAELCLAAWSPGIVALRAVVEPRARDALACARAKGPVVLASSHTGNWELAAFAAAGLGPVACVAKPMSNRLVHAICTHIRERRGVSLIGPRGAMRRAADALADGRAVAMMIDQVPDAKAHGVWSPFLGAPALVDRAPFALAARTGATVLVTAARRDPSGVTRVDVIGAFEAPADGKRAWVRETARAATRLLADHVGAYPASWLWLHRRWKVPLDGAERARYSRVHEGPAQDS